MSNNKLKRKRKEKLATALVPMSNSKLKGKGKERLSEKLSESLCFVCKDGGELIVCDRWMCKKVYHTECIGKDDSFMSVKSWNCARHYCFECKETPFAFCLGCPNSVCGMCFDATGFTFVRNQTKGLCINCWDLVWIIENNVQHDEHGNQISLANDTVEGLFKEYWEFVKKSEKLSSGEISAALAVKPMYKMDEKSRNHYEAEERTEDAVMTRDGDDDYLGKHKPTKRDSYGDYIGKRKQTKRYIYSGMHKPIKRGSKEDYMDKLKPTKRKRSNDIEFRGWGSIPLLSFLASIGKGSTKPMTELDVLCIICEYIKVKKLEKPKNKRKFFPDEKLFPIFRKKCMRKHKIYKVLESHIANNSDDDSFRKDDHDDASEENDVSRENDDNHTKISSADKDLIDWPTCMESRFPSFKSGRPRKVDWFMKPSRFAAFCVDNIKLIYLKKSLVLDLAKQPESFMGKVVGTFVRVKMDTGERWRPYHLVRVIGVIQPVPDDNLEGLLLEVSFMSRAIPISELSDDDFTEEECAAMQQKVKEGWLKKLTVEELQEKANSLHEDITKHYIATRLVHLQSLIDRANVRGRQREKDDLLDEREALEQPWKQEELLRTMPSVVPEVGIEVACDPDEDWSLVVT